MILHTLTTITHLCKIESSLWRDNFPNTDARAAGNVCGICHLFTILRVVCGETWSSCKNSIMDTSCKFWCTHGVYWVNKKKNQTTKQKKFPLLYFIFAETLIVSLTMILWLMRSNTVLNYLDHFCILCATKCFCFCCCCCCYCFSVYY